MRWFKGLACLGLLGVLAGCAVHGALPVASAETSPVALRATSSSSPQVYLEDTLPPALKAEVTLPAGLVQTRDAAQATLTFGISNDPSALPWVYALVAAFPTVPDEVNSTDLQRAWRGKSTLADFAGPILVSAETGAAFEALWGPAGKGAVQVLPADQLLQQAWAQRPVLAIIPFEDLQPRWKVLKVDGSSPIETDFQPAAYALTVRYGWKGAQGVAGPLPETNWQRSKMTVLLMTGTTALVRGTADRMRTKGITYPSQDILDWLTSADLLHISNEVSFYPKCPLPDPNSKSFMFCSAPENVKLLEAIGVKIIELSGNHVNDYGRQAFADTLQIYRDHGWKYFAGGDNLADASKPLLVEHNGNQLAFVGCNEAGPPEAWATIDQPGAAPCDYDALVKQIAELRDQGYLVIVTQQYDESYRPQPTELQRRDFQRLADAGATIVSGSQAHFPQSFAFSADGLIHYGLGNLFFDQMDFPVVGTRREFLDRHIFYNNHYISTELLAAELEDYARPRPMTAAERRQFLSDYFSASGW
jgi:hypothetical protein